MDQRYFPLNVKSNKLILTICLKTSEDQSLKKTKIFLAKFILL